MSTASTARRQLYELTDDWDRSLTDWRDSLPYRRLLDELLFHGDLRYYDYLQFRDEGSFPVRLLRCLQSVEGTTQQRTLLELIASVTFIDRAQMLALHRDAYRRVIARWLTSSQPLEFLLADNYWSRVLALLRNYALFSITESFAVGDFLHTNDLLGVPRPRVLGDDPARLSGLVLPWEDSRAGAIILEDFVGTGKQASRVLKRLLTLIPVDLPVLFVPLIIVADGLREIKKGIPQTNFSIHPVLTIPRNCCVRSAAARGEPSSFTRFRSLIQATAPKVLPPFDDGDDPPADPHGYKGSGTLLVTCYNTPNNTVAMIHHRSTSWSPIFRRVHHSKDALR